MYESHPSTRLVSLPVGLARSSFPRRPTAPGSTKPRNRALFRVGLAPALGAVQAVTRRAHRRDCGMEDKHNDRTSSDTDPVCHGDNSSNQGQNREVPPGITHSISPSAPCPKSVLVVIMSNGDYLLVGYPQGGPTAIVVRDDVGSLRQALEAAFGSGYPPEEDASGNTADNSKRTGAVLPGHQALHTTQAQP